LRQDPVGSGWHRTEPGTSGLFRALDRSREE